MAVQIFFDKLAVPIIFFFRRKIIMNVGISLNFDKNKIQVIPTCIFIKFRMLFLTHESAYALNADRYQKEMIIW